MIQYKTIVDHSGKCQCNQLRYFCNADNRVWLHRIAVGITWPWATFIYGCYQVAVSRQAPAVKMQRGLTFLCQILFPGWFTSTKLCVCEMIQETGEHASSVSGGGGGQFIYTRRQHTHEERKREIGSPPWCPPNFTTAHYLLVTFLKTVYNVLELFLTYRFFVQWE